MKRCKICNKEYNDLFDINDYCCEECILKDKQAIKDNLAILDIINNDTLKIIAKKEWRSDEKIKEYRKILKYF